jgi:hypothetical protein
LGWKGYGLLLLVGVAWGLVRARPRRAIVRKLPPTALNVAIKVGDLFEQEGNIIVGTNDCFDTQLTDSVISPASVQGQLLNGVFAGDLTDLDAQISASLGEHDGQVDAAKSFGKQVRYPLGTVVIVRHGNARYFLPAFTRMSPALPANVTSNIEWLQEALARTWIAVREAGQRDPVHMPIIGSEFARLGVSKTLLIEMIVLSFIAASQRDAIASSLTVYVHPRDKDVVDMAVLDEWLKGLCAA